MISKIVDWLSKLTAEDSLGKLEANWHRANGRGHGAWGKEKQKLGSGKAGKLGDKKN